MIELVGASDAVMLGRLSQNSMSAVSLASQVTFVFNLFMTAFVIGENMFIAQYYGKKDYTGICKVFSLVLFISIIVAILFLLGVAFFSEGIMHFLTNEPELIVMGREYLKYVGVSYLLSAISQVYLTLMKNCDDVNLSTAISSMTVILNIMLIIWCTWNGDPGRSSGNCTCDCGPNDLVHHLCGGKNETAEDTLI